MFDKVVMLTSSNWKTEAKANRYHWAKHFAKTYDVDFFQFDMEVNRIEIEATETKNLKVVHLPWRISQYDSLQSYDVFEESYGVICKEIAKEFFSQRTLVFVYNPYSSNFIQVIKGLKDVIVVYHATENYFAEDEEISIGSDSIDYEFRDATKSSALQLCELADYILPVSKGVERSIKLSGVNCNKIHLMPNAVDVKYWQKGMGKKNKNKEKIIYVGGINSRVDFKLLSYLFGLFPEHQFDFYGPCSQENSHFFDKYHNANYFKNVSSDELREVIGEANVAIIPFVNSKVLQGSLPLKLFEYLACGTRVVTTPIEDVTEMGACESFLAQASCYKEFADKLAALLSLEVDDAVQEKINSFISKQDYSTRFELFQDIMEVDFQSKNANRNVLVLYDDKWSHINTINEHVSSFGKYSKHNIVYVPATIFNGILGSDVYFENPATDRVGIFDSQSWDFDIYDAIVIHYSVRLSLKNYIVAAIREKISAFSGQKILFIQDEYESVDVAVDNIINLGVTAIFTCVPLDSVRKVYSHSYFDDVKFYSTLTGYLPEGLPRSVPPTKERSTYIGYRGRLLPLHYGKLGIEKFEIGQKFKEEAIERGIDIDVEVDDNSRISTGWYEFLASCKTTLGTESGCNIFDFDGSLKAKALELTSEDYSADYKKYFEHFDDYVITNQISPKFFEAIILKTVMIAFSGKYSGILKPGIHFIEVKKDYSNIEDVFNKLSDDDYLQSFADHAYNDIVDSGLYSYKKFVEGFDNVVDEICTFTKFDLVFAPVAYKLGNKYVNLRDVSPYSAVVSGSVLNGGLNRMDVHNQVSDVATSTCFKHSSVATLMSKIEKYFLSLKINNSYKGRSIKGKALLFVFKLASYILPVNLKSKIIKRILG